jgi:lysozyme
MTTDMKISKQGLQTLIDSEGSKQEVYLDQAGLPTIGVGHCLTRSEISSGKIELSDGSIIDIRNNRISQANIKRLLQDDLISREALINRLVKVPLAQGQLDALVHFVFNVGNGAFKNSTLLKKLNSGDYSAVSHEMRKWNIITVGGQKQVSDGLANRREVECSMWESCKPEGQVKRRTRKRSSKNSKSRQKSKPTEKNSIEKPVYKSKVIGAVIATASAYLVSKFGIEIPAEYQATIESSIVLAGLAGIGVIRRWFTNTKLR